MVHADISSFHCHNYSSYTGKKIFRNFFDWWIMIYDLLFYYYTYLFNILLNVQFYFIFVFIIYYELHSGGSEQVSLRSNSLPPSAVCHLPPPLGAVTGRACSVRPLPPPPTSAPTAYRLTLQPLFGNDTGLQPLHMNPCLMPCAPSIQSPSHWPTPNPSAAWGDKWTGFSRSDWLAYRLTASLISATTTNRSSAPKAEGARRILAIFFPFRVVVNFSLAFQRDRPPPGVGLTRFSVKVSYKIHRFLQ